ncbi:hypothetical protein [Magnetococcus sp. PR-3]|uniref:hypothetical protein n=1 Tax=Magnetococcus sp. PR-3 TaxID=3120355 RepID=UPI002FCE0CAE
MSYSAEKKKRTLFFQGEAEIVANFCHQGIRLITKHTSEDASIQPPSTLQVANYRLNGIPAFQLFLNDRFYAAFLPENENGTLGDFVASVGLAHIIALGPYLG